MTDNIDQAVQGKLRQGSFFLEKMIAARDNPFEFNAYFAACLSSVRSVALYVRHWLDQQRGKNVSDDEWGGIMRGWEATLPDAERTRWRALTRYRNRDIHEEPIIPAVGVVLSTSGWYNSATGEAKLPGEMARSSMIDWLRDPESTGELDPIEVCRVALEVAGRLLRDYSNFTI